MNRQVAFVGDVHGNVDALRSLWGQSEVSEASRVVFMGDYSNKGPDSAAVVAQLVEYSASRHAVLRGNNELALLDALRTRSLTAFLKMGGATGSQRSIRNVQPARLPE
ncbi:metallophosphoesterase [Leifsonia poae]|uniref:Calcineurin-like phosphoesterase domain-containing protein n=1 Tax=Leifsonia poae TaxID=110933 RepID=A0A9W6H7C2_9MICO|nr:hypothetical protein GCM10017584_03270 [Leifsonia poae]